MKRGHQPERFFDWQILTKDMYLALVLLFSLLIRLVYVIYKSFVEVTKWTIDTIKSVYICNAEADQLIID